MSVAGKYTDRKVAVSGGGLHGRSGNALIQAMVFRLNAAAYGGFAKPWSGLLQMSTGL